MSNPNPKIVTSKPKTSSISTPHPKIAAWPPKTSNRQYLDLQGKVINEHRRGKDLPAKQIVKVMLQDSNMEFHREESVNNGLCSDLPEGFLYQFLQVQLSENPITTLPRAKTDKNISVLKCIHEHPAFTQGALHLNNWEALGWSSQEAYSRWLHTSMLFAFSHVMHFCQVRRVFDVAPEASTPKQTVFKANEKYGFNIILSVSGFEFRHFSGSIEAVLPEVKGHSQITMQNILSMADAVEQTDIVLIPYGLGVFLPQGELGKQVKAVTLDGMVKGLNAYQGSPLTIHICGPNDYAQALMKSSNPNITFVHRPGQDAYTVANYLIDVEKKEAMLINAGDNDWMALLDPTKVPGQYSDGHTLFDGTSDEYFALMTDFSYHSVQQMHKTFGDDMPERIAQQENDVPIPQSCFTTEQIHRIRKLITGLDKEIKSRWPFPNKDRKVIKRDGLKALLNAAESTKNPLEAISQIESNLLYKELRAGKVSHRVRDLLDDLKEESRAATPTPK